MPFAALLAAGPGEEQITAGLFDLVFTRLRDLLRHVVAIFVEQGLEGLTLRSSQLGNRNSTGLAVESGLARGLGENVLGRVFANDGGLLLLGRQGLNQGTGQVIFAG